MAAATGIQPFIDRRGSARGSERADYHSPVADLCRLPGAPLPGPSS
jgi:hypothetical protein